MNFLAHAYLSFDYPEILIGNMISDFVKGSSRYSFSAGIQKGIMLHREIDQFTDTHPSVHKAKDIFRPYYRLYSSPIVDILLDHFLATDARIFTLSSLKDFTAGVYACLQSYSSSLPENFLMIFSYMMKDDWLYNYHTTAGMERSLKGLARRASFMPDSTTACNLFAQHYSYLRDCYIQFFDDLLVYVKERLVQIL